MLKLLLVSCWIKTKRNPNLCVHLSPFLVESLRSACESLSSLTLQWFVSGSLWGNAGKALHKRRVALGRQYRLRSEHNNDLCMGLGSEWWMCKLNHKLSHRDLLSLWDFARTRRCVLLERHRNGCGKEKEHKLIPVFLETSSPQAVPHILCKLVCCPDCQRGKKMNKLIACDDCKHVRPERIFDVGNGTDLFLPANFPWLWYTFQITQTFTSGWGRKLYQVCYNNASLNRMRKRECLYGNNVMGEVKQTWLLWPAYGFI